MKRVLAGVIAICLVGAVSNAAKRDAPSILFDASYGKRLPASTPEVGLWWASSGWKVCRGRPMPKRSAKTVEIRAARNETEATQLVVRPGAPLHGLLASAGALTSADGATIAAAQVEVLRVRYVNVAQRTDRAGAVAPWPDPLPPFAGPIDLAANENQPLWVRVHVPRDAAPGEYDGAIRLTAQGYEATAPLRVVVYDFALPDRMTCTTAFGFNPSTVFQYQNISDPQQKRAVMEKYWANLSAHHISPYQPTPFDGFKVEWVKLAEGEGSDLPAEDRELLQAHALTPVFDWAAWDKEMERVLTRYHFNSFRLGVPGMGGGSFYGRAEPKLHGFGEGTREYTLAFTAYAKTFEAHLREKGWLDEAFVYWFDEPLPRDYEFVMNGFRKLKTAAPDLRRMLTEQVEPGLVGGPNVWCPLTFMYRHERAEEQRRQGDTFWWYVCTVPKQPLCGLFTDHPGTDLRVWLWQTWKYGIEGILVWHTNLWTTGTAYPDHPQNPYEDPMSWMSGYGTKKGQKRPWGNGDGRFIYPPEAAATPVKDRTILDGPVDSIRFEMLRDGIEDYEYMAILRRLIEERADGLSKRQRKRYEALLEVPEKITAGVKTYTKDPAPIEKHRDRVARAIEKLVQDGAVVAHAPGQDRTTARRTRRMRERDDLELVMNAAP